MREPVLQVVLAIFWLAQFQPQLSDGLVNLQPVVAAPFAPELAFIAQVGEVALVAHRPTHQVFPAVTPGLAHTAKAVTWTAVVAAVPRPRRELRELHGYRASATS